MPDKRQYTLSRRPLIPELQVFLDLFLLEPSFGSAKRQFRSAGETQNREVFSWRPPQTPLRTPRLGPPDFAGAIAAYPVATARAPIRRTVLPNSRLVRWLIARRPMAHAP